MTGTNGTEKPARIATDQRPYYGHLLGRYGVPSESWSPVQGMADTFYASANTRQGPGHVLKVGDMGLTLIAAPKDKALSLDLSVGGMGHLPYRGSDGQIHIDDTARFDYPEIHFRVSARPESGYLPKGFDAELSWFKGGNHTVRLLVAPDFVAVVEWDTPHPYSDDPTQGKLTRTPGVSVEEVREAFPDKVPTNVVEEEDPRLAYFMCAQVENLNVGGVFHLW